MGTGILSSHGGGSPEGYDISTAGTKVAVTNVPDNNRGFWSCVNASDTPMYLALYEEANGTCGAYVGRGIYLAPNGGSFELNATNMYYGPIWVVHGGSGTKRLTVQAGK